MNILAVTAYLPCAIKEMSRNTQHSHGKGGRREEEEKGQPAHALFDAALFLLGNMQTRY